MIERLCINCKQVGAIPQQDKDGHSVGHAFFCPKHPEGTSRFCKGLRELREWGDYAQKCKHFSPYR